MPSRTAPAHTPVAGAHVTDDAPWAPETRGLTLGECSAMPDRAATATTGRFTSPKLPANVR